MNLAQKYLQGARIIHIGLLFAAIAYVVVALYLPSPAKREVPMAVVAGIGFGAFGLLVVAVFFRTKFVQTGEEKLRVNVDDEIGARLWQRGTIVSLVLAESVALFGLVVRMVGASWNVSGVFFVVGILVMLAWWPKLDSAG